MSAGIRETRDHVVEYVRAQVVPVVTVPGGVIGALAQRKAEDKVRETCSSLWQDLLLRARSDCLDFCYLLASRWCIL